MSAHARSAEMSSAWVMTSGTVVSIACRRSSGVSGRRPSKVKQAAITTCSISAPENPSVAVHRLLSNSSVTGSAPSAGPALSLAFRCSEKITQRSASVGRSMKKISSNLPLRIISGGSKEI